jgi:HK97 family phage portal protein
MSLLRRGGPREVRQWLPEPVIGPFPGTSMGAGGVSSGISSALQVSAVWGCVRLLADSVSMMPIESFTFDGKTRVPVDPGPFIKNPAGNWGMPDWIYQAMVVLLLRGNAIGKVLTRDWLGNPTQIEWISPDKVGTDPNAPAGVRRYLINGEVTEAGDIFHIRAYPMPGSLMGLSPIRYAASQIATEGYIADFAQGFFRDGAHPTGILMTPQQKNGDQARALKERFKASVNGRDTAVLSGGVTYQAIQVTPEESQFLATQKYGVASICRIFGVPPEMVAAEAGNSMTYANVEQRSIDFLTYSVQPWLTRLETAISTLLPGKQHVRFDTSVLLRTDVETRMKSSAIGIASHQLLPDEARAKNDLPPFTAEEKKLADLIPMTVTPSGLPKALPGSAPAGLPSGSAPAAPAPAPVAPPTPTSGPVK